MVASIEPNVPPSEIFRLVVFDGIYPTMNEFLLAIGIALGTLFVGWIFFTKQAKKFAYYV